MGNGRIEKSYKQVKEFVFSNKGHEIALALFVVTSTLFILSTDSLIPKYFIGLKSSDYLLLSLIVLLFNLLVARGVAVIILYLSPLRVGQILFLFINFVVFSLLIINASGQANRLDDPERNHDFHILESEFHLTVTCDGHGVLRRNQTIVPLIQTDSIVELDLYGSGGLRNMKIEFSIEQVNDGDENIKIPSETIRPNDMMSPLVHKLLDGHKLEPGHTYARVMRLNARECFRDKISDALQIVINRPTDFLKLTVTFEGGCKIDTESLTLQLVKEKGATLHESKNLHIPHRDSMYVTYSQYAPSIGDLIVLRWTYLPSSIFAHSD